MLLLEWQWCHLELLLRVLLNDGLDGVIASEDEHQYPPLQKGRPPKSTLVLLPRMLKSVSG